MTGLYEIQRAVEHRSADIASTHGAWPCQKGCADCCRNLASQPKVSRPEWERIERAILELGAPLSAVLRQRMRESTGKVCPLLDEQAGVCRIYEARPIACRTYGFYSERDAILGCHRIESLAQESSDIIWGNHDSVLRDLDSLGPAKELAIWLEGSEWGSRS
jgi:uncharacterized protein